MSGLWHSSLPDALLAAEQPNLLTDDHRRPAAVFRNTEDRRSRREVLLSTALMRKCRRSPLTAEATTHCVPASLYPNTRQWGEIPGGSSRVRFWEYASARL